MVSDGKGTAFLPNDKIFVSYFLSISDFGYSSSSSFFRKRMIAVGNARRAVTVSRVGSCAQGALRAFRAFRV